MSYSLVDEQSRLIHGALEELGWHSEADVLIDRIKRLHLGLPKEDEFCVVCAWLGRCDLIHKLDQKQTPISSCDTYQVPDLLAVFNVDGRRMSFLIEVKSKEDNTLSLRPDYLNKLKEYASLLQLPLLIAWKWHGLWCLFECKHLKKANKNYNISYKDALKENLLGVLAGDFAYSLHPGCGLHLKMEKTEKVNVQETSDHYTETWNTVIRDAYWTIGDDERVRHLSPRLQQLLMISDVKETHEDFGTHIITNFSVSEVSMVFAHTALVSMINYKLPSNREVPWRTMLNDESIVKDFKNFRAVIEDALKNRIVRILLDFKPQTMPGFFNVASHQ